MVENSSICMREIIRKTGHNLQEIRLRALENILSKLRNGIICIEDLVHHRELMVNLLQWFNHENPPRIKQVLELLHGLTKHGTAASLLHSLGGVAFLSTLRQDLSDDEHLALVDSILDCIFWIHEEEDQLDVKKHFTTDGGMSFNSNKSLEVPVEERGKKIKYQDNHNGTTTSQSKESSQTSKGPSIADEKPLLHHGIKHSIDSNAEHSTPNYMKSKIAEDRNTAGHTAFTPEWIVLTSSDRHILSVTESRLQSHSMDLVWQSCEFFRDVLLQDFPSHIFIQRPNIVKILLGLLDMYSQNESGIIDTLVACLNDLTVNLAKSLLQQASPDLSQASKLKETYSSSASSANTELSSLHSRTTSFNGEGNSMHSGNTLGREIQSNVESDPEDFEGAILTEALQQSQWSAVDYCFHLVSNVISFIKQAIGGGSECDYAVMLLNNVLNLLSLCDVKSFWTSDKAERKVYDVMSCLRHFSYLIKICLDKKETVTSRAWNSLDIETIFPLLGNLTALSIHFINLTVPYDKAYEAVPEDLLASYKIIFADEILARIYPSIRGSLHKVMKATEEEFYYLFARASAVVSSMQATMNFLQEMNRKEANTTKVYVKRLSLCHASLLSVGFHWHGVFLKTALNMIASLFSLKSAPEDSALKAKDILLRLLSHKKDGIRSLVYVHCLDIIMEALSESHVTNPLSSSYRKALFLIDTSVLEEIVSFGIASTDKEISNLAVNIVVTLLLGRLSMPSLVWQKVIYSIIPVLPLLQCFAGIDKALERALATISDSSNVLLASDGDSYSLPPLEQLRASFRFMFVKQDSVRAKGFSSIIWTLSQEDSKSGNSIRYPHEVIQNASDLFLVPPTLSSKYHTAETNNFGFNGSNLDQLWGVFSSSAVDNSLKESAAEQLSVLAQDTTLHKQLLDHDADKSLLKVIRECARQANFYSSVSVDQNSKMIQFCMTILRYLVQYNATQRHILAVDRNLYLDILRCRIACYDNEKIHLETSCLIMLLAFDEAFGANGDEIVLPLLIAKRYLLPLDVKTQEMTTSHRWKASKEDWQDLSSLEEEPLFSMIRISWNVILSAENLDGKDSQIKWVYERTSIKY